MFRKPKKTPVALRRGAAGGGGGPARDDDDAGDAGDAGGRIVVSAKKRRRLAQSSDDEDDEVGDDYNNNKNDDDKEAGGTIMTTSVLLERIRQEQQAMSSSSSSSSSKSKVKQGSVAATTINDKQKKFTMHEYKTASTGNGATKMTPGDMATRIAEYHPSSSNDNTERRSSSASAVGKSNVDDNDNDNHSSSTTTITQAAINTNKQISSFSHNIPRSKFLAGPLRATTFVRTTARFDYQPDICKDYKDTGYCGFGDTCIYLHDRGDTKSGWEMEREYEEMKKVELNQRSKEMDMFMNSMMNGRGNNSSGGGGDDDEGGKGGYNTNDNTTFDNNNDNDKDTIIIDDGIPYACHICRKSFTNPIITSCGHYFDEGCLLAVLRGGSTTSSTVDSSSSGVVVAVATTACPICNKDTHGVMNYPTKLLAKKRRLVGRDGSWEEYMEKQRR